MQYGSLLSQYKFFYILDLSAELFDDGLIDIMAPAAHHRTFQQQSKGSMEYARPFNAGEAQVIEKLTTGPRYIRTTSFGSGDDFAGFIAP